MFEIKKGKTQTVPVRMMNVGGDGQASINYTDVTASLLLSNNTIVNLAISASAWYEASGSIFGGMGVYTLQLHSGSVSTTGSFVYAVSAGPNVPAVKYLGALKCVEVETADTFNIVVGISGTVDRLRKVSEGRWKMDAATKKMTLYTLDDPTVPFIVFGLTGSDGAPSTDSPFERRPVG